MPRPRKCRKVCCLPENRGFFPNSGCRENPVILTVDEYETIRLIDKMSFSQEECGKYMDIARTTVQQIYTSARQKLAEALVAGRPLKIEGGEYRLCSGQEEYCACGGCKRHSLHRAQGGLRMKIAIPLDDTQKEVCVSFGRAPYFLFAQDGNVEILENPAASSEGGAGIQAAQFVVDQGATALVTVRCGENAAQVLQEAEIAIYKSQGKDANENVKACEEGNLEALTHFHAGFQGIG